MSAGSQTAISFLQLLNVNIQQRSCSCFRKLVNSVTLQYCYAYLVGRNQERFFWQLFYPFHFHPHLFSSSQGSHQCSYPSWVLWEQNVLFSFNYLRLHLKGLCHPWGKNASSSCLFLFGISPAQIIREQEWGHLVNLALRAKGCACCVRTCWYCCLWETPSSGYSRFLGTTFSFSSHWALETSLVLLYPRNWAAGFEVWGGDNEYRVQRLLAPPVSENIFWCPWR